MGSFLNSDYRGAKPPLGDALLDLYQEKKKHNKAFAAERKKPRPLKSSVIRKDNMKRLIKYSIIISGLFLCFLADSALAQAMHSTKSNCVGCFTEEQMSRLIQTMVNQDERTFTEMILTGQCIMLDNNVPVYIIEQGKRGLIKIHLSNHPEGIWTVKEAIR